MVVTQQGKLDEAFELFKKALVEDGSLPKADTLNYIVNVLVQQNELEGKKNHWSLVAGTCRDIADVLDALVGRDEEVAPFREEAANIDKTLVLEGTLMNNMMRSILEDTRSF